MSKYIVSLDQGTTSSRAVIFDDRSQLREVVQKEFKQIYPKPGWVEHDPVEILRSEYRAIADTLIEGGVEAREIAAIGITNQRETAVLWDKTTGEPVYNAVVWQCRRTSEMAKRIIDDKEQTVVDAVKAELEGTLKVMPY